MDEPVTALVPLSDLYIHPFNTRSTPPGAEIEALADSIDQMGLLQNLSGYNDPAGRLGGDPTAPETGIGIVAGGRRLRALQLLAARNGTESGITVPVQITDDEDTARLWASAPIWNWQRPLSIGPSLNPIVPERADATLIDERLANAVNDRKAVAGDDLTLTHLTDVQALTKRDRNARLTAALARLFAPADSDFAALIARETGADIRKVWTPTAENYFSRLPVARLDAIWEELVPGGGPDQDGWLSMKKALKAKDLERLFRDQDFRDALFLTKDDGKRIDTWLPAEMKWPAAPAAEDV